MLKLLIVEDEKNILDATIEYFEGQGYSLLPALSGKEALAIIQEQKPELILLDLYLEDMSGMRLIREAKAVNPKACVMVLTGFDDESIKEKAFSWGADYFFAKPIPIATLKKFISEAAKAITEQNAK